MNQNGFPITGIVIKSSPIIADVDGNSIGEVYFGSDNGNFYGYTIEGNEQFGFPFSTGANVRSSPAVRDVDLDGVKEIVFGSNDGNLYIINAFGMQELSYWQSGMIVGSPALIDLDLNGDLEMTKKFLENGCDLVFNATVNGKTIENYLDTRKHGDVMISLRPSADEWEIAWRENNKCHPLVKNWNFFGVGVVVNDCEIASEYFSNLGFSLEKGVHESEDLGIKFCHLKVGSMMFEFIEPTTDNSVYKECFNTRGEGIADMSFVVEDLASEVESLVCKGADLLISTNELALIDTRREGNILIRLLNINA